MTMESSRLPAVIAHRGASGYRPENTLAAFDLAIEMGAEALEIDVVMSGDRRLVVRHESRLDLTTDAPSRCPGRAAVEELTLEEIRELRTVERWPDRRPESARHDGRYGVPLLGEVLALVRRKETKIGRRIGLHIELKDADRFRRLGLPMERRLLTVLGRSGVLVPGRTVFLQSFQADVLERLSGKTEVPLMQLTEEAGELAPAGEIARYASAVGPAKELLDGEFVESARTAGLGIYPFSYRADREEFDSEVRRALDLGVDGIFTDHPDLALRARDGWSGS